MSARAQPVVRAAPPAPAAVAFELAHALARRTSASWAPDEWRYEVAAADGDDGVELLAAARAELAARGVAGRVVVVASRAVALAAA